MLLIIIACQWIAHAQVPGLPSADSIQLQQLINNSDQQLKAVKELIRYSQQDATSLERASRVLDKLSAGLDKSIEKYQGTKVYEQALLELQSTDRSDEYGPASRRPISGDLANKSAEKFARFQKESLNANLSELKNQEGLAQALRTADQGFIPKLTTQAMLGNWQSNTRVSAQMTELLWNIHALREDMRTRDQGSNGLAELLTGSEILNQKQREIRTHERR